MDGDNVKEMLRMRAGDAKVNVRKAAIQALESVVKLDGGDMFNKQVLTICLIFVSFNLYVCFQRDVSALNCTHI